MRETFEKKDALHRQHAALPIEEKVRMLVELQKITLAASKAREPGEKRKAWVL